MDVRAVVFDLFGTLVDDAPPAEYAAYLAETANLLGVDAERFAAAWEAEDVARYTGPIEACFQAVCSRLGVADYAAALALRSERVRRLIVPRPDALPTLTELRRRRLRLGMISNAASDVAPAWAGSALARLFDAVLFSAEEAMMKPDPRLYERMATTLRVAPEECLYVGDGAYHELQGAAAVGMRPVLIRAPYDEVEHEGTIGWAGPRISSLSGVLALL